MRRLGKEAVARRLNGEAEVGLFLSGGLDSSVVALWLGEAGAKVRAFSLDFGERSVEREQAAEVAKTLGIPLEFVPAGGEAIADVFWNVVRKLDLPFGDAVTAPQYLLGRAARKAGVIAVFNGEGGDQLFGGWTSKPREPRGDVPPVVSPLLRPRGGAVHRGLQGGGRRTGAAPRTPRAVPRREPGASLVSLRAGIIARDRAPHHSRIRHSSDRMPTFVRPA
ncbi:MAG TPA: asparagine synthase C-terminal domain-containing protein [Kofleriaceae bacterium]|nr:asparagine synthase C-terminal domain-containing protein [Kofleriaceae bacterium]